MKKVYLDYASTTPVDHRVLKAMLPYFSKNFGNPSSIHSDGVVAKKAVDGARTAVARTIEAHADEIIFTSGGTESNNLAIFGVISALEQKGISLSKMHCITTNIEHSSILESFEVLEKRGVKVDYVAVGENGLIDPKKIISAVRPETVLISVGYANNEIGTVQPIREISKLLRNFPATTARPIFHSDASQAFLYLDCNPEHLGVDLLTFDGHKMYGPKGVGALYVRRGTNLSPILAGGGQENGLRSTTENVPGIVGFAKACEIAKALREKESARLTTLRDYCIEKIFQKIPTAILNGDAKLRLPNNINISIPGFDSEFGVLKLDAQGISCSTKSSCLGSSGGSYVVEALGGAKDRSLSTMRFTLGRETTKAQLDYFLKVFFKIVSK